MPEAVQEQRSVQELELEAALREKLESEYQKKLEDEVRKISQSMQEENKKTVQEAIERFRKEMLPPSEQDIQKLLDQDYLEFHVKIPISGQERSFTLKELPHGVEKRIFKKVKEKLVPYATELAGISAQLLEGDAAKKLVEVMNTFEPVLDVLVSTCTVCLNPYNEEKDITDDWVANNLSSTRIVQVIMAQAQCNRIRDFFSLLLGGTKLMTR